MKYEFLKQEVKDGVLILTISKEKTLNALNTELLAEINDIFGKMEYMDDVDVIVVTGAGKAFVAGADISEMANLDASEAAVFAERGMHAFMKIEKLNKPVIAAINGFALGGGCELALACDIRIASTKAKMGQPEVGLGITPGFGGTQRLARAVGLSRAKELIYTADVINADEAYRIGLVNRVVEPEELMNATMELANKIKKNSKSAVRRSKEAINTGMQADIDTAMNIEKVNFGICFSTEDQKEGMKAFLEKRPAKFISK